MAWKGKYISRGLMPDIPFEVVFCSMLQMHLHQLQNFSKNQLLTLSCVSGTLGNKSRVAFCVPEGPLGSGEDEALGWTDSGAWERRRTHRNIH